MEIEAIQRYIYIDLCIHISWNAEMSPKSGSFLFVDWNLPHNSSFLVVGALKKFLSRECMTFWYETKNSATANIQIEEDWMISMNNYTTQQFNWSECRIITFDMNCFLQLGASKKHIYKFIIDKSNFCDEAYELIN